MILSKIVFFFGIVLFGPLHASAGPTESLMMAGAYAPIADAPTQAKKQVRFKDELECAPTAVAISSYAQAKASNAAVSPLAAAYAKRFKDAAEQSKLWREVVKPLLPFTLTPSHKVPAFVQNMACAPIAWIAKGTQIAALGTITEKATVIHTETAAWSTEEKELTRKVIKKYDTQTQQMGIVSDQVEAMLSSKDGSLLALITRNDDPFSCSTPDFRYPQDGRSWCFEVLTFNTLTKKFLCLGKSEKSVVPFFQGKYQGNFIEKPQNVSIESYLETTLLPSLSLDSKGDTFTAHLPFVAYGRHSTLDGNFIGYTIKIPSLNSCKFSSPEQAAHKDHRAMALQSDYTGAHVCDVATKEVLYALTNQGQRVQHVTLVPHLPGNTKLATVSDCNELYIWDMAEHQRFITGDLAPEQLEAMHLLADQSGVFKQKYGHVAFSLQDYVRHIKKPGITTTHLAGALITVPDVVRKKFLAHYNVCTQRQLANIDGTPQEDYLDAQQAFDIAQSMVSGHMDDKLEPLAKHDEAKKALEEYMVDEHAPSNPADAHHDTLIDLARVQEDQKNRTEITQRLFAAIKAGDLKKVLENLNPLSINDKNPHERNRTPLMHAIMCHKDSESQEHNEIFKALLHHQELIFLDSSKHEMRHADLIACDDDGVAPLKLALSKGLHNFALRIVQAMQKRPERYRETLKKHAQDMGNKDHLRMLALLNQR